MASGGDGLRSVRRTEEGGGRGFRGEDEDAGERERGSGTVWRRGRDQGRRRQPGREEVAGARGRARRARARVLLAREEDDRGVAVAGWASGRSWPAGPATGKWPR